jgi:hypothetical protein
VITMQPIIEAVAVLFVMLLVLRVSLARRRDGLRLRGGLVALNVVTGALAGFEAALAAGVMPFLGLALGGLRGTSPSARCGAGCSATARPRPGPGCGARSSSSAARRASC